MADGVSQIHWDHGFRRNATIMSKPPAAIRSTAATPKRVAKMRSKGEGDLRATLRVGMGRKSGRLSPAPTSRPVMPENSAVITTV